MKFLSRKNRKKKPETQRVRRCFRVGIGNLERNLDQIYHIVAWIPGFFCFVPSFKRLLKKSPNGLHWT
jgi:hypothetical protein